jgi:ORF6N domain.
VPFLKKTSIFQGFFICDRFPEDFMFQLSKEELKNLMFQNGRSSWGGKNR